jgi:hypothetical protein
MIRTILSSVSDAPGRIARGALVKLFVGEFAIDPRLPHLHQIDDILRSEPPMCAASPGKRQRLGMLVRRLSLRS